MDMNFNNELELQYDDFIMIRDFIHEKSGIFFADNKMYLVKNRLIKRMNELGINSYRDYFYHVKYDTSLKEFNNLMNLVTTNETSFFRNEPQLLSFSEEVLPLIINEKKQMTGTKTLRIWSAGCSTGEEPYTLAIIILEKLKSLAGWKVEIIANDISEQALQKARQGEYSGLTLRNTDTEILNRYFIKNGDVYRVKQEIKALVNFSHLNLNDPRRMSVNTGYDTIFCRNVMIYFSEEVKKELVRRFFNTLRPGGYFYIGHSETLHGISKAFKLVYFKNALVYHKEVVGIDSKASSNVMNVRSSFSMKKNSTSNVADGAARALDLLSKIKTSNVKK